MARTRKTMLPPPPEAEAGAEAPLLAPPAEEEAAAVTAREEIAAAKEVILEQAIAARTAKLALDEVSRQAEEARGAVHALREQQARFGLELTELHEQARATWGDELSTAREQAAVVQRQAAAAGVEVGMLRQEVDAARKLFQVFLGHADELRRALADMTRQITAAGRQVREVAQASSEAGAKLREVEQASDTARQSLEAVEEAINDVAASVPAEEAAPTTTPAVAEGRNRLGVTVGPGVVVDEVLPASPAEAAGLARGDVIRGVNGTAVRSAGDLRDQILAVEDGDEVALQLVRAGAPTDLRARLSADDEEGRSRFGATVGPGVVVAEVLPGSPAEAAGVTPGDVIAALNGEPVATADQMRHLIAGMVEGAAVTLRVVRAGATRDLSARLDGGVSGS